MKGDAVQKTDSAWETAALRLTDTFAVTSFLNIIARNDLIKNAAISKKCVIERNEVVEIRKYLREHVIARARPVAISCKLDGI